MNLQETLDKLKQLFSETENKPRYNKGEIYFLLIGIDDYKREKKLNFCIDDSEKLLNLWLEKSNTEIKTKNIYKIYNSKATKINIRASLRNLSKVLQANDQLVIHLSGYGFSNVGSQFFIPFDGNERNIYSCISNVYINAFIKELEAENILLLVNTWNNVPKSQSKQLKNKLERISKTHSKNNSIYDGLINFLKVDTINRNKEIFWFSRESIQGKIREDASIGEWRVDEKMLKNVINKQKKIIEGLLSEGKVKEALDSIKDVVENNDTTLDSQVETLKYKYQEYLSDLPLVKETEVTVKESNISKLSSGLVNRIDENGFFLINLPENKDSSDKKKNRTVILFTSADPSDQARLRLNDEFRNIEYELMLSKHRDNFELIPCLASRITDFQRKLLNICPQIIHFSGHGQNDGICLLGDDSGMTYVVDNEPLANLFKLFSDNIQCIFLNSCHSINQSKLLQKDIRNIICMNSSVDDKTAIHFAASFYAALSSGQNIKFSFEFAKNSIDLHKLKGSEIPQLLEKQG